MGQIPSKTCGDHAAELLVWISALVGTAGVVVLDLPAWGSTTVFAGAATTVLLLWLLGRRLPVWVVEPLEAANDLRTCSHTGGGGGFGGGSKFGFFNMEYWPCTASFAGLAASFVLSTYGVVQLPPGIAVAVLLSCLLTAPTTDASDRPRTPIPIPTPMN